MLTLASVLTKLSLFLIEITTMITFWLVFEITSLLQSRSRFFFPKGCG